MRWIPPGRFLMGSPEDEPDREDDELPHEVELTQGFWMADTASTQTLWEAVMGENPSKFNGPNRPVENVSWDNCQVFLNMINEAVPGLNLCLPTEAQWEYACRAGTTSPFWFGDGVNNEQVNYFDSTSDENVFEPGVFENGIYEGQVDETVEVGTLPPNGWGLYEMHGNVFEWCSDWYGEYEEKNTIDPQGPTKGEARVLRGGSWFRSAWSCRSAYRLARLPGGRNDDFGFRLSRGQEGPVQVKNRNREGA